MSQPASSEETPAVGSVRRNVVANFLGQGLRAVMGLVFIPVYVAYMGVESYGIVGLFGVLQSALGVLDVGMRPTLGREMARFSAGAVTTSAIRALLRSIELVSLGVIAVVWTAVLLGSHWIAVNWVNTSHLPTAVVAQALVVMGGVAGLRFMENIYVSSLVGLQRQVLENGVSSLLAVLRGAGAVAVLAFVAPTIEAYLVWQGVVSVLGVAIYSAAVYRLLPAGEGPARFSVEALKGVWGFASGMLGISLLSLVFTQMDKVLLSRLLSLESFGYYTMASVAAGTLGMLASPISAAVSPRLTELFSRGENRALSQAYHNGAQLIAVLMGSAAVVWAVFSDRVLLVWTANPTLVGQVAPLTTILAIGSAGTYLVWIPYAMQLARGWTSLILKVGGFFAVLVFIAILIAVPRYGAYGAAWIWLAMNHSVLLVVVFLMHREILPNEEWRWLFADTLLPILAATAVAMACKWLVPATTHRWVELVLLAAISLCVLGAAAMVAPASRAALVARMPARWKARFA